jgi:hypothetical protein
MRRGGWCGGQFALSPNGAALEEFLFPDGDGVFEGVDGEAAGIEGSSAMRCADGDEDAGFTDFEATEAMNDGEAMNGEFFVDGVANFTHFGNCHGLVSLVFKVEGTAAVGFVADKAVERDDRAVVVCADVAGNRGWVDGRVPKGKEVAVCGSFQHGGRLAPAHRGKKGDGITLSHNTVPGSKFLVSRSHERTAKRSQFRKPNSVTIKQAGEGNAVSNFEGFFGDSGEFSQATEKQHLEAKIGWDLSHGKIVT